MRKSTCLCVYIYARARACVCVIHREYGRVKPLILIITVKSDCPLDKEGIMYKPIN